MHAAQTLDIENTNKQQLSLLPWITCFVASLFFFYEFIQMNMPNAISAGMMDEFGLTATQFSSISSTYFLANVLFLIPAGIILDRFSTRIVILVSLALCVLGTFAFGMSHSIGAAAFFRFLTGIGSGFCFLSNVRLATRWFPPKRIALITGLIVTMAMMGGMFAQTPLVKLVNAYGWRHAISINAAIGAVIFVAIALIVRDYPPNKTQQLQKDRQKLRDLGLWKCLGTAFLNKRNWYCGAYTCFMNLPLIILGGLLGGDYLHTVHGLTPTQSSYATSMIFFGTVIGSPFMGWLSDLMMQRRKPMIIGALASVVVMLIVILAPITSTALMMVMFWLLGFITSTQVISYPTVAESNPRELTASCVSVVSLSTIGGLMVFEPIFGELIDYHWAGNLVHGHRLYTAGDFNFAMWLFPICFMVSLVASLLVRETHCKNEFI